MNSSKVKSMIDDLDDEIDELEEALSPLLKTKLAETASKLPVLDKAKLYVLVTYAIESMLFSYLRLHGVKAREHPVFTELTRVKQYFDKIHLVENPIGKRDNMSLDKVAAARIIKAGLTGNDKWDEQNAIDKAAERARAHIKFEELSEKMKQDEITKKRKAETEDSADSSDSDMDSDSSSEAAPIPKKKLKVNRKSDSSPTSGVSSAAEKSKDTKSKKSKKKSKKSKSKSKN